MQAPEHVIHNRFPYMRRVGLRSATMRPRRTAARTCSGTSALGQALGSSTAQRPVLELIYEQVQVLVGGAKATRPADKKSRLLTRAPAAVAVGGHVGSHSSPAGGVGVLCCYAKVPLQVWSLICFQRACLSGILPCIAVQQHPGGEK